MGFARVCDRLVAAATLAFNCANLSAAADGAGALDDIVFVLVAALFPAILAFRASAFARAWANIALTSGFDAGVVGLGEPLLDLALFESKASPSSGWGRFSDKSAMVANCSSD